MRSRLCFQFVPQVSGVRVGLRGREWCYILRLALKKKINNRSHLLTEFLSRRNTNFIDVVHSIYSKLLSHAITLVESVEFAATLMKQML